MSRFLLAFIGAFFFIFTSNSIAEACMGVSRTINVRSFQTYLGAGASGGIGLRHKEVVLTFDDGPSSSTTPRVLSALASECTKATFFVVGRMARANPKLLQKIARSGHTIAHHTQQHRNLTHVSLASAQRNIDQGIFSVRAALGPYKGRSTKLFRYPYLARNSALDALLRRKGMLTLSAQVMSQDWKSGTGSAMVARVMSRLNKSGSGVILLHDIQPKTASALPLLLRRLKQGGYKIVHIRSGGSGGRSIPVASLKTRKSVTTRSKSSQKKHSRKLASLKEPKTLRRWSLFGRNKASRKSLYKKPTASKRKKLRSKTTRIARLKKKSRKRKGLFGWSNEAKSLRVRSALAHTSKKKVRRRTVKKAKLRKRKKPTSAKKTKKLKTWLAKRKLGRKLAKKYASGNNG